MMVFVDIETIALPAQEREFLRPGESEVKLGNLKDEVKIRAKIADTLQAWERGEGAALDPLQARIALIGYAVDDGPVQSLALDDEAEMLRQFWKAVAPRGYDADQRIVGHCIRFDASMLVHRSWIRGVAVPPVLLLDLFQFSPHHWLDTAARWQLGNRQADLRKLKHLCGAFGIQVKDSPVTGATFGEWWAKDREICVDYNRQDVEAVRDLWLHIGHDGGVAPRARIAGVCT